MKPQEFEELVRAKAQVIETTQEPIAESAPIPVLKPMNINQLDRQYNALLGESSLREFAGNDLDESVAETTMAGGTEAYTMEDEQLDGMALGELQAIAQAAKKIFASVKQGVPLEAWMYKKITNGNEGLTAVAQQINNPAVREQPGVAEGEVVQFPKKHPYELLTKCPECGGPLQGGKDEKGRLKLCMPCMNIYRAPNQQGVAEGHLEELANTSLKVKEPKDMYNVNDRKQTTYKLFKFKSGKNTFLINFTVKSPPTYGKKQNWNAVIVSFGVKEKQDDYSFGDEMNTDLTGKNKNQFLIYSTVINTIRRFITEYNTEIDEIIMQGAGERQEAMYQRFFQSAGKYFPGWHYDGKHSLVRDVPRQKVKKVREQGVAEGSTTRGGFGGSASQAQHEIQWLKNKIETLKPLLAKKPSVARQIKDLERQIRERELAIAYQKEGVAEGLPQTLRKVVPGYAKREIDRKMDAGKFGKTDADKDANFQRYKKIQDKLKKQGVAEGIFDRFKKKQPAKPQRMPITDEQRAAIIQHFPTNHNANLKWGRKENDDYVLPDNVTVQFGKCIINFINYDGNLIASVAYYRSKEDRMNPKAIPLTHFDKPINSDKDLEQLKSNLVEGSLNEFAPAGFDGFEGDDRVPMHFIVEKDSYNPRSKWKKSYKPQGGGIALFTTKQEAIQAAEKFNKLDPNREFKYGGTQLVHVEDDDKQLDEFAPGNGDDDDFDPETANMAHQEGVVKGFSLVDGATVEQALQIPHCQWGKLYNGQYKQYFVKGFIDGRKAKLEQARKDGVELSLQKDGSLSRVQQGVAEGWIDDDAAEPLAKYFADLYYGDFSVTMKIKLAAHIYQSIQNGELTIEQLKAEIDMLEKEKGIKEQGVAEGNVEKTTTGLKHTRDYEYPTKGREFNKDLDRLNKTQTGILDKALGVEWTPTNKRKEITGDQTGVAENFEPGETKRVLKSGGKPAGEIGLDPEASPGNGAYYIKHYASGKDLGGYDTYQEALEELRYIDKQYQHANRPADTRSKHQKMMDNPAYAEGYRDGKRGVTGKNVADIFGPMSDVYHQGYKAGKQGVTEGLTEIKKGQKDSNGYTKCWPGKHAEGTKKGKNGGQVRNCVPNESVEQDPNDPQWSKKYNKDVGESTTKIPTGLKHHGDYGSKYPPEEYRDEYGHRVRGQKYVPGHEENEYDHRGRPPKAPLAKVELPADAFGRVSGKVPKGKQGIRISGKSNTDESTDYASAVNNLLNEFAGGMGVSSVAVGPGAMKNPAKTGSLFGGSYTQKNSPFKKKATKKESVIKR